MMDKYKCLVNGCIGKNGICGFSKVNSNNCGAPKEHTCEHKVEIPQEHICHSSKKIEHYQIISALKSATKKMSEATQIITDYEDKIERLINYAAEADLAFRDDDSDLITEGFRALPDDLQKLINNRSEQLDTLKEST